MWLTFIFFFLSLTDYCFGEKISCLKQIPNFSEPTSFGMLNGEIPWGAAERVVDFPIEKVYEWLLKHENWKDMSKTKLKTKKVERADYQEFHEVEVELRPFLFISIDWIEHWGYEKTKAGYKIDYTKTSGTSHIKHLCGQILLSKASPTKTRLQFYEECNCSKMTPESIAKSVASHADEMSALIQ